MTAAHTDRSTSQVESDLLSFLTTRTKASLDPDTDLFASGHVSSLFAMELVVFIEGTFDVRIEGKDLTLDTFRTVRTMTALVHRLRAAAAGE
ncbi:acyl carrier protein [Micromonosporaceae bacterium Da 78-11]